MFATRLFFFNNKIQTALKTAENKFHLALLFLDHFLYKDIVSKKRSSFKGFMLQRMEIATSHQVVSSPKEWPKC